MSQGSRSAFLVGWGSHHPSGRLTNSDLVDRVDTTHEWLDEHVGINERRVSEPGDTVAGLGAAALGSALTRAGLAATDLDVMIGATSVDDHDMPAAAARIADVVGSRAFTFDVRSACSGWPVGIEVARTFLESGRAERIAVVAAEQTGTLVDPDDRASVVFFGDGAGAGILTATRPAGQACAEVIDTRWHADNSHHAAVRIPRHGHFAMDGHTTRTWVEKAMTETAGEILGAHGLTGPDLRALVCHQANGRLIERFASTLGVPPERHWHNVEWAGNTWAAGAASSLAEGLDGAADQLADGDHLLVIAVGAGLNVVANLLRWCEA
jgi:3-oxoacyl-[acyl-carrier-protein] synthase-3